MIIVVSEPDGYHPSCERWGKVVVSPPVYGMPSSPGISAKQTNIMAAMWRAVSIAEPGDLILQNDIDVYGDPWAEPVDHDSIRTLVGVNDKPGLGWHCCPQAFIMGRDAKSLLEDLWDPVRIHPPLEYSCIAWAPIPKQVDYLAASEVRLS